MAQAPGFFVEAGGEGVVVLLEGAEMSQQLDVTRANWF